MSDFDEEAERERLREKYERDKRKREATEQMSDLLLKGATMTNSHCGTCGDPIFRYEGQEFCPTCQTVVDEGEAEDEPADTPGEREVDEPAVDAPAETRTDAPSEATGPDETTDQPRASSAAPADETADAPTARSPADAAGDDASTDGAADASATSTATSSQGSDTESPAATSSTRSESQSREPSVEDTDPSRPDVSPSATGGDDTTRPSNPSVSTGDYRGSADETVTIGDARESLTRTLVELAREAERSDDLGRTREYLVAAREAADALDAVERADR